MAEVLLSISGILSACVLAVSVWASPTLPSHHRGVVLAFSEAHSDAPSSISIVLVITALLSATGQLCCARIIAAALLRSNGLDLQPAKCAWMATDVESQAGFLEVDGAQGGSPSWQSDQSCGIGPVPCRFL